MKNLTREERETVLDNIDADGYETIISTNDAEDCWNVCTASPMWIRRLEKMGAELVKVHDGGTHKHYRLAIGMVSIHKLRQLSDEQKKAIAERGAAYRQSLTQPQDAV